MSYFLILILFICSVLLISNNPRLKRIQNFNYFPNLIKDKHANWFTIINLIFIISTVIISKLIIQLKLSSISLTIIAIIFSLIPLAIQLFFIIINIHIFNNIIFKIKLLHKSLIGYTALFYRYLIGGMILTAIITIMFKFPVEVSKNQQGIEKLFHSSLEYIIIVQVIFIAPIIEEIIFRLSIFNYLYRKFQNENLTIFISALLFGLAHVTTELVNLDFTIVVKIIPYVAIGMGLGKIRAKSKGIELSILFHALHNIATVSAIFI